MHTVTGGVQQHFILAFHFKFSLTRMGSYNYLRRILNKLYFCHTCFKDTKPKVAKIIEISDGLNGEKTVNKF